MLIESKVTYFIYIIFLFYKIFRRLFLWSWINEQYQQSLLCLKKMNKFKFDLSQCAI